MYPLRLYWFSDGVFVTDALAESIATWSARGSTAIAGQRRSTSCYNAIEPLVSRDNEQQVLSSSPLISCIVANILHGLGLS